jgi:hypothetical protein
MEQALLFSGLVVCVLNRENERMTNDTSVAGRVVRNRLSATFRALVPVTALESARSSRMAWWRLPVAVGWFTVGLCILLALSDVLRFTFHSDSGIQGWISANKYPKQQEMFWFLSTVVGIPVVMLTGWVLWVAAAALGARMAKRSPAGILKAFAVWHLPLLVAWPRLCGLRSDAWKTLIPAAGCVVLLSVVTVLLVRFVQPRFRRAPTSPSREPLRTPHPRPAPGDSAPSASAPTGASHPPRWRNVLRIAWRVATGLFVFAVVPSLLYLLLLNPVRDGHVDAFHEGEFLVPLNELQRGGVPYRDIYLQHGLFYNALIPWFGAKLIEPTLAGVRDMRAYVEPLGSVAFYLLVLFSCRTRLLAAAYLGFLFCGSVPTIPGRAVFGALSIAVLAAALKPPRGYDVLVAPDPAHDPCPDLRGLARLCLRRTWRFAIAGALAMLAFWHSVEIGLYSLAAGGLFLAAAGVFQTGIRLWRRLLPLVAYGFGVAIVFIPFGFYFAMHGALDDLFRNVWIQCAYQNETWGKAFPKFFDVFRPILVGPKHPKWPDWLFGGSIQWYYGVVTLALAAAFLAFRSMGEGFWRSRTAPQLLLITLTGIYFFRTVIGRSDWHHIHYGVLFAIMLAIFFVDRLLATSWDRFAAPGVRFRCRLWGLPWLVAGVACAASLVWFGDKAFKPATGLESRWSRFQKWPAATTAVTEVIPRGGPVAVPDRQAEQIREVVEYIGGHTNPDDPVFDFSSQSALLFFAARRSATRYFHVCYASLPGMQEEVVRDLERQRVQVVVFRGGNWRDGFDGVPVEKRHPIIAAYLRANYEPADTVGSFVFWRRKP